MKRIRSRGRRYWYLLQQLPEAVLVLVRGRIGFANHAAAALLGADSSAQLRGASYNSFLLSASPMQGGGEHHKLRRMDGAVLDVEAISQGPPHFRRVVLRDLSRLVSTETALRRSEERFRLISETVRDRAIVTLDALGDVVHWTDAANRITGYTEAEIIGRPFSTLFTPEQVDKGEDESLLRVAIERGRAEQESWKQRANGSQFYAAVSVVALLDRGARINGFAVMLRDLTPGNAADQQRNEEQLRQAQRMEAVGRLASGIAHDFNNLLTAIHGHAQFLIEDLPEQDASRADAEEILRSADRAAALTRQLLAFSRGQSLKPQTIDLNQTVTSIEKLLRRVITENITLETALDRSLAHVSADPNQVEQVLVNLVVNARDAMPEGGRIMIRTANAELPESYAQKHEEVEPGDYVVLAVSDDGVGMTHETQQHIFEPFFTTKEPGKGTGLGLSTVYGIVREAGGHIFVYSEPGQGTIFKIYFPAVQAGARKRAVNAIPRQHATAHETVLIVEDDAGVRGLAKRVLEARGYKVILAESGTEALSYVRAWGRDIALAVVDVVLPDASGADLTESITQICPSCRIMLMSGYTSDDVQRQNKNAAHHPFVEKPFTPDAFVQKVRDALESGGER